jgi:hypothetical protein
MSTSSVVHLLNLEQLTPTERQRMTKLEEQRQRYFLFFIFYVHIAEQRMTKLEEHRQRNVA